MTPASKKTTRKKPQPGLEEALSELETLVEQMEDGELPLEEALARFQRGVELTRICRKALADVEHKVQLLQKKAGVEQLVDFEESD